jgi:DNA-binding NarL/FixJ family response regulator
MDSEAIQVPSISTKPTRALVAEIKAFCQQSRLTPRETEVVFVLAEGLVRIKEIAERLDLSPNTVNNHVNSIFVKTKTRSKSQLLSILLNRIASDLYWARLVKQTPRVLCVCDAVSTTAIAKGLDSNRYKVSALTLAAASAAASAHDWDYPHFVLCELKAGDDPESVITKIRSFTSAPVVLHSVQVDPEARCQAMDAGAIDLIQDDEPVPNLEILLMGHFIEDENDRWDFFETKLGSSGGLMISMQSDDGKVDESSAIAVLPNHCGIGGFFVPSGEIARFFKRDLSSGEWLEFPVLIGGGRLPVKVRGQVVWVRSSSQVGREAGAGLRLVYSDAKLSTLLAPRQQTKSCYIPAGAIA